MLLIGTEHRKTELCGIQKWLISFCAALDMHINKPTEICQGHRRLAFQCVSLLIRSQQCD
jgi:hypothetical protein